MLPQKLLVKSNKECVVGRESAPENHIEIYHLLIKNVITDFFFKATLMERANGPITQR